MIANSKQNVWKATVIKFLESIGSLTKDILEGIIIVIYCALQLKGWRSIVGAPIIGH